MSAFEPISRAHDGFVDILHVGRSVSGGFFYYVMELADDEVSGPEIEITRYKPKTLKAEHGHTLPAEECLRLGLLLADALGALHRAGLAHRDINLRTLSSCRARRNWPTSGWLRRAGSDRLSGRKVTFRRKARARRRPMSTAWAKCFTKSAWEKTGSISRSWAAISTNEMTRNSCCNSMRCC